MKTKKYTRSSLNKDYFQSLASTRASINKAGGFFAGTVTGLIFGGVYWSVGAAYGWNAPFDLVSIIFIASILFTGLLSFFASVPSLRNLLYKHQNITAIFQTIFVMLLILEVTMGCLFLSTYKQGKYSFYNTTTGNLALIFLLTYLVSVVYNIFWLKGQLNVGFSTERTKKNFLAKPTVQSVGSLALIFSGSMMGKFLSAEQTNIFGIVFGLFFIIVFSRLNVEYAYLAKLKRLSRIYWEKNVTDISQDVNTKPIRTLVRILLEVVLFFGIIYIGLQLLEQRSPFVFPLRMVTLGILIYWIIRILLWLKRKYFTSGKK